MYFDSYFPPLIFSWKSHIAHASSTTAILSSRHLTEQTMDSVPRFVSCRWRRWCETGPSLCSSNCKSEKALQVTAPCEQTLGLSVYGSTSSGHGHFLSLSLNVFFFFLENEKVKNFQLQKCPQSLALVCGAPSWSSAAEFPSRSTFQRFKLWQCTTNKTEQKRTGENALQVFYQFRLKEAKTDFWLWTLCEVEVYLK